MGHTSTDGWFSIALNEPFIVIPDSLSNNAPTESGSDSQGDRLKGTVILRLTKPTKVKSLSITFAGYARTSFHFDSSSIPGAQPCLACDKHNFGCTLTEQRKIFLSSEAKGPHVLPTGTHRFPFSFEISQHLPAVISSGPISINYQVTASLQLVSLLPFASPHQVTKPVILLQKDELPSDDLFNTALMRMSSKKSERLSSYVTFPCAVLPQEGLIPLTLNLSLKGNATTVTKITIELIESILAKSPSSELDSASEETAEVLIDERLVTKQNCPIQNFPSSTVEEPVTITKRLMFKTPQLPLSSWSKSEQAITLSCPRFGLEKGFCHPSGSYANAKFRVAHSLRVVVLVRGLSDDAESTIEYDSGENETAVWIVGNQEFKDDDTHPPSYYRSFSTPLVDGDKIHEMDQQAIEALQDDLPVSVLPPGYQESLAGSSARSSPTLMSWPDHSQTSLDQFSLNESIAESTTSHDTYADDLAAYTQRYSHANHAVFAT